MKRIVLGLLMLLLYTFSNTQAYVPQCSEQAQPLCTTNCGGGGRMCKMEWDQTLGCFVKYCCYLREGKTGCEWYPVGIYC